MADAGEAATSGAQKGAEKGAGETPVYVINLDRSRDRWEANWAGRGFARVPAVDGRALDVAAMKDTVAPATRTRVCAHGVRESKYDANRPEHLGCFLSHRRAWKRALDDGRALALVFEDDVRISDADIERALSVARARFAAHPELDLLVFDPWDVSRRGGRLTDYAGMYAYAVSDRGARRALEATRIIDGHVDRVLGGLSNAGELNVESASAPRIRFSGGSTLRHNLKRSERVAIAFGVPLFLLLVGFIVVAALLARRIRDCARACRCAA